MRFFFVFAVALALALPLCFAANESSVPPAVPGGEGVVFARAMFANGTAASNAAIVVVARSNSTRTDYRLITDQSGRFVLSLPKGAYDLDAVLDYYSTPGIDFASTAAITPSDENITMYFYPAGSLAGTVAEGGAPVPGARVRVSCPSDSFDYVRINGADSVQSGEAGDFLFRALPAGGCQVSSSTGSLAGSANVIILAGQTVLANVEMKKKAVDADWIPLAAAFIAVAVLAYAATRFFYREKGKKEVSGQPLAREPARHGMKVAKRRGEEKESEQPLSDRLSDPKVKAVLATLSDREKEIVRFLFKAGGRAKRSQLQHKLLIPKTSLLRNLRSLERKKIVKLTPFGRNLLAEIDGWLQK